MELIKNVDSREFGYGKVRYQKYLTNFKRPQRCGG